MEIIEISKKYLKKFYNNDISLIIGCKDGIVFNDELIKKAFNRGNGTILDFKRYMNNNKIFCYYYDLENNKML